MKPRVEVVGLGKKFGDRWVLKEISLEVGEGEILVIMGSSGGGKTTLLRCISGLLKPAAGTVRVAGHDVLQDPEAARRQTGMVFQYAALFDYLNVRDNILFGVRRRKRLGRKEQDALVADQLQQVGLGDVGHLLPSELSGGMRKRVGLARALALEPCLLLYDEPTSGLDPVTAYSIDQLIVETRDRTGATSIVVSHDVSSVLRVADRVAFLSAGSLAFWGTRAEFQAATNADIRELLLKSRLETLTY